MPSLHANKDCSRNTQIIVSIGSLAFYKELQIEMYYCSLFTNVSPTSPPMTNSLHVGVAL